MIDLKLRIEFDDLIDLIAQLPPEQKQRVREVLEQDAVEDAHSQQTEPPPGTLAALIAAAARVSFHSGEPDIADRSREILEKEFTDYLLSRMETDDAS